MNGLTAQLGQEVADVLERVRPSLVQIGSGRRGGGAGTIWHESGLILSNAHVAARSPLQVTLANGTKLPARVLARDAELDIAALSVSANGLPTIGLGESKRLRAGQLVLALGHPWGVVATATAGVVVGMGSQWPELPTVGNQHKWDRLGPEKIIIMKSCVGAP